MWFISLTVLFNIPSYLIYHFKWVTYLLETYLSKDFKYSTFTSFLCSSNFINSLNLDLLKLFFYPFYDLSYCKTSKLILIMEWATRMLFVFSTVTYCGHLLKLSLIFLDQLCTVFDQNDLLQPGSFCIMPAKPFLLHILPDILFKISKWQLWLHA